VFSGFFPAGSGVLMPMKIIDLTQPLYSGMPVYPGDPEVKIETVQTIDKEGWDLQALYLSSHLGTHVNVSAHMVKDGKTLDDFPVERFWGPATVYAEGITLSTVKKGNTLKTGVIFREQNIDKDI